jgi:hypothetical protein
MSGNPLVAKDPKIFIFLIPFVAIVALLANIDKKTLLEFEATGTVYIVEWNTKNHGMPLLVIKQDNLASTEKRLQSNKFILTPDQIKVGDNFKKASGSNMCLINGVDVQCIK